MFLTNHSIQKPCKRGFGLFFLLLLVYCGPGDSSVLQSISFSDTTVVFQDSTCTVNASVINSGSDLITLSFLSASFTDKSGHKHQVQLDQNEIIKDFKPVIVGAGDISKGTLVFNLAGTKLTPPIAASTILVGVAGDQVSHFVGDFSCN